ncbi:MAG TPA: hypothetical protein VH854_00885, partial [Thermoanaerobaculia bacterium]|nr:hypothetical protein [Thermoanaerobaculia bacterium]
MKTLSRIAAIVALLGLVLDPPARAQDNVWVSHGPSGVGFVSGFAFGDAVAYAATPNGVFRSRDGGATWEPGGLQGENVGSIATCPAASVILASVFSADGTTWTLRASSDGGASWSSVSDFAAAGTAAVDPWHPTNVYAAATDGSVWKSVDSGASWSRLASPTGNPPQTIVLDSHAIFVESFDSTDNLYKIFRSSDDGATWSRVSPPILYPSSVAAGNAPGVVYAGGFDGFCRSADSAATWSCAGFPGYPASVVELPAANGAGARILAGVLDGAYFSDDSGRTWQPAEMGSQPPGYFPSFGAARSGSPLLAGTIAGILRSDDRGSTWLSSSLGLRASDAYALALDPQAPSTIWANLAVPGSPRLSLFRSADNGFTWSAA